MNRKTVFISSVQSEFAKERKLLADYIRRDALFSMYFEPFLFEELPAQDRSAQTAYLEQAANAEVYLLLMGEKYGYEDGEGISPTEVWNPGKLPQGMTIAKLNKEHTSNPVNLVLANPVYLAGYIEQMGTGTTDIIDRCVENGLRKPEFHQDEDFRVVLWRPEAQEGGKVAGTEGGKEGGKERGKVAGKVAGKVDKNIARIILAIRGNTASTREIMAAMKLKGGDNFRSRYLYPSIEAGYVSKLYPDSVSRPDQAYYLTEKGLQLLSELLKE